MTTKDKIYQEIRLAGSHGVHADTIKQEYKINGGTLRGHVRQLRREGIPIASGSFGYKIANEYSEIKKTAESFQRRALSMLKTANKLKGCFNISPTLFDTVE